MFTFSSTIPIGYYGQETSSSAEDHRISLWSAGNHGALEASGADVVDLNRTLEDWDLIFRDVHGVFITGQSLTRRVASLYEWCRDNKFPFLAVDQGMLCMNESYGGSNYENLALELPEALQHRHPPEPGVRHAIEVFPKTRMADIYGEGEIIVNSEHRRGIRELAKGFQVGARALDGVIEAVEATRENWFGVGVQWQPASGSASGLDIQVFRALVDAGAKRMEQMPRRSYALSA